MASPIFSKDLSMDPEKTSRLTLTVAADGLSRFLPLLGQGFTVKRPAGASVEEFLCRECGIAPDYLRDRVQTVFLNGKAIDDLAAAEVSDGATSALSAAMPGLAFTDGQAVSMGINRLQGGRSAPTAINRVYSKAQFWDGRAQTLVHVLHGEPMHTSHAKSPKHPQESTQKQPPRLSQTQPQR